MPSAKPARRTTRTTRNAPLLKSSDFRNYLIEKAALVAPGDVDTLLSQSDEARQKAAAAATAHPRMERQVDVALQLLDDHFAGECPQIPYQTVALLAVAVLYLLDPMDVVPDWIPNIGTSDDALVLELAFETGAAGVERYCTFKELPINGLFARNKRTPQKRAQR